MKFKLMPSGENFFKLFEQASTNIVECAHEVSALIADPESSEEQFKKIKGYEQNGDVITTEILRSLDTSFITPFDREDIHGLAEAFDDVVDEMYGFADLMNLMRPGVMLPELATMAGILESMVKSMHEVVVQLESPKNVKEALSSISKQESSGDETYRHTMARLFSGEFEALEVLKWKDILQSLETALNKVEDVSDVIESIVLKHA